MFILFMYKLNSQYQHVSYTLRGSRKLSPPGGGVIDNEVREGVRGLFLVLLRYEFNGFGFQGGQDPQPIFRSVQVYKTCKQMFKHGWESFLQMKRL